MKKSQLLLCFSCANVFRLKKEMNLTCPECGFTVNLDNYEKLFKYARDAIYFGYNYRKTYENQYEKEGKITTRFKLASLNEILIFIGIPALSGIIGGISYDIVKKAISKIKEKIIKVKKKDDKHLNVIFNNISELNVFIKYIDDFYNGLQNISKEIKDEITREMFIHFITFEEEPKSEKEIYESLLKAKELIEKMEKPISSDFKEFWKNLK